MIFKYIIIYEIDMNESRRKIFAQIFANIFQLETRVSVFFRFLKLYFEM